jgi:hypothetical protein
LYVKDATTSNPADRFEKDSLGHVKQVVENDSSLEHRRNYQKHYAINYLDGDSLSGASYGYGKTTLVSDSSRVIKGGSWMDRPYWLSPGTRRFMEENQSASSIGFRWRHDLFWCTRRQPDQNW